MAPYKQGKIAQKCPCQKSVQITDYKSKTVLFFGLANISLPLQKISCTPAV